MDMNLTNKVVVVTDADWDATLPEWNIVDYSATKAAMADFAKSRSKEFGPKGIRVNTISPGPVSTDLWLADDGVAAQFAAASGATQSPAICGGSPALAAERFREQCLLHGELSKRTWDTQSVAA
jgi:NAD(P)-dependent dehydrogenase (short-subunit alcohol dehydrogenase family)